VELGASMLDREDCVVGPFIETSGTPTIEGGALIVSTRSFNVSISALRSESSSARDAVPPKPIAIAVRITNLSIENSPTPYRLKINSLNVNSHQPYSEFKANERSTCFDLSFRTSGYLG
jgi:hypothetical protein